MKECSNCQFFRRMYYQIGRCNRSKEGPNAKFFPEDGKSDILVHATFSCVQRQEPTAVDRDTI